MGNGSQAGGLCLFLNPPLCEGSYSMHRTLAALLTTVLSLGTAQAASYNLSFDAGSACGVGTTCSNWSYLSQSYGDVAGVVDVSLVNANSPANSLQYWYADYNDLRDVAFAGGGDSNSHGRIELKALNGGQIQLNSMDFGAYPNTSRGTHIRVTTIGGGTTLFSYDGNIGLGSSGQSAFAPAVSSTGGLWIDWYNSAYNVGIDNVNFSVNAVPEPETWAMLLTGLGLIGARRRRTQGA